MKNFLLIAVACLLLLSPAAGEAAPANSLAIVLPLDRSFVESGLINVVLKGGEQTVNEVQITVNDKKQAAAPRRSDRHYSCYDGIRLSYGMNKVRVIGLKDGRKAEETMVQVFYRSDLSPDSGKAPPGFKRYLFHSNDSEKGCYPCHEVNLGKLDEKKPQSGQSPCYVCHKKILSNYKFVHGPAAVWSCLECHDRKSRNPKLAVSKPDDRSCTACHEKSWDSRKFKHGPTAAGNCTTCHNPHAADKPFFLKMDTGDLCSSCHEEVLSRPHILTSFSQRGGHPLSRSPDPFKPDRDFNCASCHNPHGSDSSLFLNAYQDSMSLHQFCRSCHRM